MTPDEFVAKWEAITANERAVAQSHFNDLCKLLDVASPLEDDPTGQRYAFEKAVHKAARGRGFADVWKDGAFAWEYKSKGRDLGDAYRQLLLYRDDLNNPPLLVVSDIATIEVHTNFTGTTKAVHSYKLADLLDSVTRTELRKVWTDPTSYDPRHRRQRVTQDATEEISRIALSLRDRGNDPVQVAHFLMQLVFALFAEDIGLLPNHVLSRTLERARNPERVQTYLTELFAAMATGGDFLLEDVEHFNGALFDGTSALLLTGSEIASLHRAASMDWAEVEPAIFGTLFERSLDPSKRSQLGAHYTSRDDILRIVEPVIMRPLRERWKQVRDSAEAFLAAPEPTSRASKQKRIASVEQPVTALLGELQSIRILDPACGSGNFLYVALQELKDLEHEVVTFAEQVGVPGMRFLGPKQLYGIEINLFARELASMVVWIGYLQWNNANGIDNSQRPILEPLENIRLHDALINDDGTEFEWPHADFIIGNPPFLGNRRMRTELGDAYVDAIRELYSDRVSNSSDLVCYWFEKARNAVMLDSDTRVGLIATNSIRGGANRKVLERIKSSGDIFLAWSDQPWILEGAAVRVSIVAFDDGRDTNRYLDGRQVQQIHSNLTSTVDISSARVIQARKGLAFQGTIKSGQFEISSDQAAKWIELPNPTGVSNRDVLRPWTNGMDILQRPSSSWIIDFNEMTQDEAKRYVVPYAHIQEHVMPVRLAGRDPQAAALWWRHHRPRPKMRRALLGLERYICTPRVSKHRIFVWLSSDVLPDSAVIAIAANDDFTFGVLHSRIHELWSLTQGTSLGVGNDPRYTPTTSFETFPFPSTAESERFCVSEAAKHLLEVRKHLLSQDSALTLTDLYNEVALLRANPDSTARAFPLVLAHESLDTCVAKAYAWDWPLPDDEILSRLLALNLAMTQSG